MLRDLPITSPARALTGPGNFVAAAQPLTGPLLIDEYDSTIVVPPAMQAQLDEQGNVVIRPLASGH